MRSPIVQATTARLSLHLHFSDGAPVHQARVVLSAGLRLDAPPRGMRAFTDPMGLAHFDALEPGEYVATLDGWQWRVITLAPGEHVSIDFPVLRNGQVEGRVVSLDGEGIADSELCIQDPWTGAAQVMATSGDDGRFDLGVTGLGQHCFARKTGYAPSASVRLLGWNEEVLPITLSLERANCTARGFVVDETGRPVAGAEVLGFCREPRVTDTPNSLKSVVRVRRVPCGGNGEFVLYDLLDGEILVLVQAEGFAPSSESVKVAPNAVGELRVTLRPGGRLIGSVSAAGGRPVSDVELRLSLSSLYPYSDLVTRSDVNGAFSFHGLPDEKLGLHAFHPDHGSMSREVAAAVESPRREDIVLPDLAEISGRVVDERGEAMRELMVWPADETQLGSALTADDGRFNLRVPAGHSYTLEIYPSSNRTMRSLATAADIAAGTADLRIVVTDASRPSAMVSVRLIRPAGYEGEALRLSLVDAQDKPVQLCGVRSDGVLQLGPLAPGSYGLGTVGISSRLHADEVARFTLAPDQHLDLGTLEIPAPVIPELRVRTTNGRIITELRARLSPLPERHDDLWIFLREGKTTWRPPLKAGEYALIVDDGDGYVGVERMVSLRAGPPNLISLELPARQRVVVTVEPPAGEAFPTELEFELLAAGVIEKRVSMRASRIRLSLDRGRFFLRVAHPSYRGELELDGDPSQPDILRLSLPLRRVE